MGTVTSATEQPETPAAGRTAPIPRLIATDLDGTLLHDDKTVSDRTVAALAAAEAAGIEVFFVTGRPARWMDVASDHVHGHGLAICANGAAVVDLRDGGRFVEVRPLEPADARAIVTLLRAAVPGTSFAAERTTGFQYEPEYPPFQLDPCAVVAPAEEFLAEGGADGEGGASRGPILKLLAHHPELAPDAFLSLARTAAGEHGSITRSSPTPLLEISGLGVSKASTLAGYCAAHGIVPEEVVAFGDMPNDLEMLGWAGTSYAMANAHPEVLAATTHRTAANNEDGVAAVIEQILHACV
ncbi:Cof-type HAD-IIB family hydrolase [Streptomyces huiliensis]|uniref:Cof-type HAD-IIB family hydrolase n=1 Tax=Streptomyces huiliensis TaxID=2876027 RepID=UPI001CC01D18|nr:Cof-type HAD-IIB family hydrolase [Streptomyces huiliensis]MBZ4323196.1 Cof-type HAD-IIB family hydrolase [Streptomyces huiliensis]